MALPWLGYFTSVIAGALRRVRRSRVLWAINVTRRGRRPGWQCPSVGETVDQQQRPG
jgi:hypothetical protein